MSKQNEHSADCTSGPPTSEPTSALVSLYGRLLAAGVTKLTANYEVGVGIGQVQWKALNAFGQIVTSQIDGELTKDLVSFVLLLLERRYPNWPNGTGAYGRIDWNLRRNHLFHKHSRSTVPITTTKHRGL